MNAVVPFNDMEKMAGTLARNGLFGTKDPQVLLSLMLIAQAEGLHPATVAVDYDVIQGKPAKKPAAMLRDFTKNGGKVEWHALNDEVADATFSHPAGGTVRVKWDMAKAQRAQLGGRDMWKKYPSAMLRSRCVAEAMRAVFPVATGGLYTPEEVRDMTPVDNSRPDDIQGEVVSEDDLLRRDMAVSEFRDALEADIEEEQKAAMVFAVHSKYATDEPFYRLMWAVLGSRERSAIKAYVTQAKAAREMVLANGRSAA
jgi:hypothetical protein